MVPVNVTFISGISLMFIIKLGECLDWEDDSTKQPFVWWDYSYHSSVKSRYKSINHAKTVGPN